MPRYVVEGAMTGDATLLPTDLTEVLERNLMGSVTWICSFVGERRTYALYEGPHPEAVRRAARMAGLEVERVSQVQVLDPWAYSGHRTTLT